MEYAGVELNDVATVVVKDVDLNEVVGDEVVEEAIVVTEKER